MKKMNVGYKYEYVGDEKMCMDKRDSVKRE